MKLRVEFRVDENAITLKKWHNCNSIEEYYNKYYKKDGILFWKDQEAIYYDIDVEQMPIKGQILGTRFGMVEVDWAYYELEYDPEYKKTDYYSRSLIIVKEV